jgi:hypothetical protein
MSFHLIRLCTVALFAAAKAISSSRSASRGAAVRAFEVPHDLR